MLTPMRILVTGFGSFRGIVDNPSDRLARAIGALAIDGAAIFVESPLPVEYEHAAARALERARHDEVDAVLALGLARRATSLRVEAIGRRDATSNEPDEAGSVSPASLPGPAAISSSVDVTAMIEALASRGVDAERSEDAGGYVCNDLYYRLLHARTVQVLFVHVPDLPEDLDELARSIAESFIDTLGRR
jgi:pyroglutamyl-peptidase